MIRVSDPTSRVTKKRVNELLNIVNNQLGTNVLKLSNVQENIWDLRINDSGKQFAFGSLRFLFNVLNSMISTLGLLDNITLNKRTLKDVT